MTRRYTAQSLELVELDDGQLVPVAASTGIRIAIEHDDASVVATHDVTDKPDDFHRVASKRPWQRAKFDTIKRETKLMTKRTTKRDSQA